MQNLGSEGYSINAVISLWVTPMQGGGNVFGAYPIEPSGLSPSYIHFVLGNTVPQDNQYCKVLLLHNCRFTFRCLHGTWENLCFLAVFPWRGPNFIIVPLGNEYPNLFPTLPDIHDYSCDDFRSLLRVNTHVQTTNNGIKDLMTFPVFFYALL